MIQLSDTLLYDKSKPFEEQDKEVQNFIRDQFYSLAQLNPTDELVQQAVKNGGLAASEVTIESDSCKTTFDIFVRPIFIVVSNVAYTIEATRVYQDASNAWRLHSELLTVKAI